RLRRVAAIDCGTNSIRLLIADVDDDGTSLRDVTRLMEVVRLGQDVDRTRRLHPDALDRTLAAVDRYAQLCVQHRVEDIRFVATSATRDAVNREEFFEGVRTRLGVEAEVISGAEEAALSFTGATSVLPADPHDRQERLVVDIGGGSTELVLGTGRTLEAETSIDVGCVRMSERHLLSDPPTSSEIAAARADIAAALDEAETVVPVGRVGILVGVAGSVTTVTAHALDLPTYDPHRINGAELALEEIHQACAELLAMPREQRAALP